MRFKGTVTRWDEAKGFGFIAVDGGERIFFHHSDVRDRALCTVPDQPVTFEMTTGAKGKRAVRVEAFVSAPAARQWQRSQSQSRQSEATRRDRPPAMGVSLLPLLALLPFGLLWAALVVFASPPRWAFAAYLVVSVATFAAYAQDKSAARSGGWRTRESRLHLLAVLGGWPGALLAHHLLRHKSRKAEFRSTFWMTVVLNVAAFVALSTPWAASFLRTL